MQAKNAKALNKKDIVFFMHVRITYTKADKQQVHYLNTIYPGKGQLRRLDTLHDEANDVVCCL
ncbi:hypothetical protein FACS189426_05550 [Bacteroidia bacterium]|nr:hypothetical protein FACS189426_05550 [Bacteroidia bacterium]